MPTLYAPDYQSKVHHYSAYGNAWTDDYAFPGAIASGDKVYLGIIPAGVRVYTVTGPADLTLSYEPATSDGPIAGDFTTLPITFNDPVKLVGTAGAALADGASVIVMGQMVGAP